ncbi:poly-gamma-glutamate synthesis protein (capsule biosynthesis protein) [Gracilibacillus ureilyticus]|uniref:Poly-gamma-glutamate synthesis protein (Capsule biosynthesis protein) n=1 Tax=Gracilibacillus ureilyticus TaxID=531814 RepID=A0A1H9NPW3_9BACI|nr:CapA family protein [Gracilibacillus ureilyticus]SER37777.1 poly-gamma-glutamate synthesis protein (capsule biosynthesis protein) [Gracilibacillus ureilyticus]
MRIRLLISCLIVLLITGCSNEVPNEADHQLKQINGDEKNETGNLIESLTQEIHSIHIAAVGDLLIHDRVYNEAKTDKGYNFLPMLEEVQQYLEEPAITIANQETITGGSAIGLSSYPKFNSPLELADNLKDAGIDVLTLANNHTLDRGEVAIQNAISYYEKIGMEYTGSYKSKEDKERIRVIETDEQISVAFLSYTYGTNGMEIPEGKDYLVNIIDRQQIKKDVTKARTLADIVITSYHFGDEYERYPNNAQKDLAQFSADIGVDVVIGHHPHVLQPIEWIEGNNGDRTLVAYSLGNFLSGQDQLYRRIGGIFQFEIEKTVKGNEEFVQVLHPSFLPTFVNYDLLDGRMKNFSVIPLSERSDSKLAGEDELFNEIEDHLTIWLPELEVIKK